MERNLNGEEVYVCFDDGTESEIIASDVDDGIIDRDDESDEVMPVWNAVAQRWVYPGEDVREEG